MDLPSCDQSKVYQESSTRSRLRAPSGETSVIPSMVSHAIHSPVGDHFTAPVPISSARTTGGVSSPTRTFMRRRKMGLFTFPPPDALNAIHSPSGDQVG